uniref:YcfA-like protein n=1 Tax=Chlorobium chlorochromatii (strain CaD3) TaxID=340177 RepID=Q3AQR2_CHLCH
MAFKIRDIEVALEKKGFKRVESDHSYFIYFTIENKKSRVRTKTSHGHKGQALSDNLFSVMAKQCKLNKNQFSELIQCPLSRNDYEKILDMQGMVK